MKPAKNTLKILAWVALFAIAMGYLESAVVIYIRELYYPDGFAFPLKVMDNRMLLTEFFREVATLVMLIGIGVVAGRSGIERFGLFIYAFGWWDIFYYVFLKILIDWPESMLTWDVLFFIPTTWVGPVIAPCLNALTMILLGGLISHFQGRTQKARLNTREWTLLIAGSVVLLVGYMQDYSRYMMKRYSFSELYLSLPDQSKMEYAVQYVPEKFNWALYLAGQILLIFAVILYYFRLRIKRMSSHQ